MWEKGLGGKRELEVRERKTARVIERKRETEIIEGRGLRENGKRERISYGNVKYAVKIRAF